MTEPKDGESFFRKVARFVANPTTDWAEINSRQDDPEGDQAKAELRAMVDRKRRNDFVRKRELDMLRRIRREGLTPEQLAALGSAASSRLDDVDRISEMNSKIDLGVKAKIDEIEQQMAVEHFPTTQALPKHPAGFFETSTTPQQFAPTTSNEPAAPTVMASPSGGRVSEFASAEELERLELEPPPAAVVMGAAMSPLSDAKPSVLPNLPEPKQARELPPLDMPLSFSVAQRAPMAELREIAHDPELDEAVIAFANADYESCERGINELIRPGGQRNLQGDTWLVMFDLFRATGQAAKFEALALDYAQLFGLSAPQWYSMPKMLAEAARSVRAPMGKSGGVSWSAPEQLSAESVQQLDTRCQNLPMPWVLDWSALRQLDSEASGRLRGVFRNWATQQIDMRWLGGDHLLQLLTELAPVGVREVDPALWMLRLEALRLVNRPDQFDEAAIDYCVTYEVSPPSWERSQCRVRLGGVGLSTNGPPTNSIHSEQSTSFLESQMTEHGALAPGVTLELSGQLSGDISERLSQMTTELGAATVINISCPRLIRLDFMAAGDLLNWVLSRRSENRSVTFSDAHRLVALFFVAMGINEHAKIKVRQV
ncbi:STAS domain-containing protein [Paucibacter sp. AS339]|uniref:STAS domain-containing protein n=1 Tax=Paucibacter hankyongi TaxID=3133434 RepID=UPI0030985541